MPIPSGVSLLAELEGAAQDRGSTPNRKELRSDRDEAFDWDVVAEAVYEAISDAEGHSPKGKILKAEFARYGLIVIDTQKEFG